MKVARKCLPLVAVGLALVSACGSSDTASDSTDSKSNEQRGSPRQSDSGIDYASTTTVVVPAFQDLHLGETRSEAFSALVGNDADFEIRVETIDEGRNRSTGFELDAEGLEEVNVERQSTLLIRNNTSEPALVSIGLPESIEGGIYQLHPVENLSSTARVSPEDFSPALGDGWSGNLTYRDFSSEELMSIPVDLQLESISENELEISFSFPEESSADSKSVIAIQEDGLLLDGRLVLSVAKEGEDTIIRTLGQGEEEGRQANLFQTYTVGPNTLRLKNEYQILGSSETEFRNEFVLSR
jgi:hypothetical protein